MDNLPVYPDHRFVVDGRATAIESSAAGKTFRTGIKRRGRPAETELKAWLDRRVAERCQ